MSIRRNTGKKEQKKKGTKNKGSYELGGKKSIKESLNCFVYFGR